MRKPMLAMELIPVIRGMLADVEAKRDPVIAGRHAALWRAQQYAARFSHTMEDLRAYCLESLTPRRHLEETDYLRGYREGFQAVLSEIRRLETRG